jgi:L-lactate dehydrogenase complex protein LldG
VSAREEMLSRIRTALGTSGGSVPGHDRGVGSGPAQDRRGASVHDGGASVHDSSAHERDRSGAPELGGEPARSYRLHGSLGTADLLDLLAARIADYRATVRRTTPSRLAATIGEILTERGVHRVVVPPGLDLPALPAAVEAITDAAFPARELDGFDGAVTAAAVAIAETGTIVLDASPDQGRRAITLVPDYHLCIVRADQVVALVPEAIARLRPDRPLTWISGPSATSDIEIERVEGVHGPRTLDVVLVEHS